MLLLGGRDSLHGMVKAGEHVHRANEPVAAVTAARVPCEPPSAEGAT
jgi:hypothetical protein